MTEFPRLLCLWSSHYWELFKLNERIDENSIDQFLPHWNWFHFHGVIIFLIVSCFHPKRVQGELFTSGKEILQWDGKSQEDDDDRAPKKKILKFSSHFVLLISLRFSAYVSWVRSGMTSKREMFIDVFTLTSSQSLHMSWIFIFDEVKNNFIWRVLDTISKMENSKLNALNCIPMWWRYDDDDRCKLEMEILSQSFNYSGLREFSQHDDGREKI